MIRESISSFFASHPVLLVAAFCGIYLLSTAQDFRRPSPSRALTGSIIQWTMCGLFIIGLAIHEIGSTWNFFGILGVGVLFVVGVTLQIRRLKEHPKSGS